MENGLGWAGEAAGGQGVTVNWIRVVAVVGGVRAKLQMSVEDSSDGVDVRVRKGMHSG